MQKLTSVQFEHGLWRDKDMYTTDPRKTINCFSQSRFGIGIVEPFRSSKTNLQTQACKSQKISTAIPILFERFVLGEPPRMSAP